MKNTDNKLIAEFMGCTNPFNEMQSFNLTEKYYTEQS